MNKKILAITISTILSSSALADVYQQKDFKNKEDSKRYIIKFKENTSTFQRSTRKNSLFLNPNKAEQHIQFQTHLHSLTTLGITDQKNLENNNAIAAELTDIQLQQITSNENIEYIELDPVREIQSEQRSYGISMIQAPQLSDSATGDIKVCIVDTGYDISHPDLPSAANITGEVETTAANGERDLGVWYEDSYGHGTHMAGTIAALGNNDIGMSGVNPSGNLNLHIVKVLDNSNWWRAYGSDLIAAVDACVESGANIINLSLGGHEASLAEEEAIQQAYDAGVLVVSAAGNGGTSDAFYPASYDAVISATAVDKHENIWMFSNNNDQVELSAAGVEVKSTMRDGGYATWDGTSISAAMVSGGLALLWSHHQECTNKEIRNIAQITAKDRGEQGYDTQYGYGILQIADADERINNAGCDGILNYPPTIELSAPSWVSAGSPFTATPIVADPEDDQLTFDAINLPAWMSINTATGELYGIPDVDSESISYENIQISVSDGENVTLSDTFSVSIISSMLSAWVNSGEPHTYGQWLPSVNNQSTNFTQNRIYLQPQTRTERKRGLNEQGEVITLGLDIKHSRDSEQSEARLVSVLGEGWVNRGELHSCSDWLPSVDTINLNEVFTQTQECQQDQVQQASFNVLDTEIASKEITQVISVAVNQEAVGTKDYIVDTQESCGNGIWQAKVYQHELFTPSCLDFTDDRFFTQNQPWTQDRVQTCQLNHTWASGATSQTEEYRVEDTLTGSDNTPTQGCKPFIGQWSDSVLIGSTACASNLAEQFPGTPTEPLTGTCTKRSKEYFHVDIIEQNSSQCEGFEGKHYVGQFKQTCID